MNAIQKKRLRKWIEFVEKVPTKKFYFQEWGRREEGFVDGLFTKGVMPDLHDCTTSGCAAGWLPSVFPRSWGWSDIGIPTTNGDYSENCVAKFFGLDGAIADSLVLPCTPSYAIARERSIAGIPGDVTARQWARHARRILKAHKIQFE